MLTLKNLLQFHSGVSAHLSKNFIDYEFSFTPFNWKWGKESKATWKKYFGPFVLRKCEEERDPISSSTSFTLDFDVEAHPTEEIGYGFSFTPLNWMWGKAVDKAGWSLYLGPLSFYKMINKEEEEEEEEELEYTEDLKTDNFSHDI